MPTATAADSVRAIMQDTHASPAKTVHSATGLTAAQRRAADQVDQVKEAERAENAQAMNQGMTMLSLLIAGVLVYGGLGFVGDHFLHTRFLLPIGIVLGAGLGIFMIIRRVSAQAVEYGFTPGSAAAPGTDTAAAAPDASSTDWEDR